MYPLKKKMSKLILSITIPAFIVSSCAPSPHVPRVSQYKDVALSCADLMSEIALAESHKINARSEDRFKWQYIFIVPTVIGIYQWNKAEKAAQQRIEHLQKIYQRNNCESQQFLNKKIGNGDFDPYGSYPTPYTEGNVPGNIPIAPNAMPVTPNGYEVPPQFDPAYQPSEQPPYIPQEQIPQGYNLPMGENENIPQIGNAPYASDVTEKVMTPEMEGNNFTPQEFINPQVNRHTERPHMNGRSDFKLPPPIPNFDNENGS